MFRRDIRATISNGENLYFCISGQRVIKTDGLPVHHDYINLRMWNATRFNNIFYGGFFGQSPLDKRITCFGREKKIEFAVKATPNCEGLHVNLRLGRWRKRIRK